MYNKHMTRKTMKQFMYELLFAIVFLVTVKSAINWIWGVVGIILFGVLMILGIKLYKTLREKKNWEKAEKEILEEDENSLQ